MSKLKTYEECSCKELMPYCKMEEKDRCDWRCEQAYLKYCTANKDKATAKYNGIIHKLIKTGIYREEADVVTDCETVCGLCFEYMGTGFYGGEVHCEKCEVLEREERI